ncbi:MAG: hypothetical protein IT355_12045 [Gemmatimonadaceae bacterium]|nr:hypothetical protein [Gemmatimonadaceae bacterium]
MRVSVGRTADAPHGAVAAANAALAQLAPPSETLHWLHCYYEPGDPWAPVERLVIAEMVPRAVLGRQRAHDPLGESLLDELLGPHPRAAATWSPARQRLVYPAHVLPPSITARQWALFRELDAFALPQVIVQGTGGGHVRHLNRTEQRVLAEFGRAIEAPAPGALPWAVVDTRTLALLRERDRLREWLRTATTDWARRTPADVQRARKATERAFNAQLLRWLDTQFVDLLSEDAGRADISHLPTARPEDAMDWDAVDAAFLDEDDADAQAAASTPRGERTLVAF